MRNCLPLSEQRLSPFPCLPLSSSAQRASSFEKEDSFFLLHVKNGFMASQTDVISGKTTTCCAFALALRAPALTTSQEDDKAKEPLLQEE